MSTRYLLLLLLLLPTACGGMSRSATHVSGTFDEFAGMAEDWREREKAAKDE